MINKIELDLDGVLLDFKGHYYNLFGKDILSISKQEMWENIHACNGFYENIPLLHDGLMLFDFCINSGIPVEILTATGKHYDRVSTEKITCVRNTLSKDIIVKTVEASVLKSKYASPTSILIDDQTNSIHPWIDAGGIGILHTSAIDTIGKLKILLNTNKLH